MEWIKVSDRGPENREQTLVIVFQNKTCAIVKWQLDKSCDVWHFDTVKKQDKFGTITHWAELETPKP
jgi:hypothetical protein